ncbi:uncharacterized protein LOC117103823 isoform X3 [Anneissia japonica]|uniref:uncharacterized protein LOC117103823 isoform X3 n=1 Tax=Anneissia japonica TaxID=1529436 RepID=UPI00142582D0|nr:uncharacterized protein LOC117103823 isoform X3 [Anneissia japonica]
MRHLVLVNRPRGNRKHLHLKVDCYRTTKKGKHIAISIINGFMKYFIIIFWMTAISALLRHNVHHHRQLRIHHILYGLLWKKDGENVQCILWLFAGLGSSCNHVAAVIFKLDHAFMTGVSKNQVPCTSKTCSWNVYRGTKRMKIIKGNQHELIQNHESFLTQ